MWEDIYKQICFKWPYWYYSQEYSISMSALPKVFYKYKKFGESYQHNSFSNRRSFWIWTLWENILTLKYKNKHVKNCNYAEKQFQCDLCDSRFNSQSNLMIHKKRKHLQLSTLWQNVYLQIKKYRCEECAKSSKNSTALKYHIKTKHEGIKEVHKCK